MPGRNEMVSMPPNTVISTLYILIAYATVHTFANSSNGDTLNFIGGLRGGNSSRGGESGISSVKGCNIEFETKPITFQCQNLATFEVPPASPPESDALEFMDQRLAVVYPVIQKFKSIITSDPLGITKSWVGSDVCSYKGFYCDHPPDNNSAIGVASIDFNGFQLGAPSLDGFIDQLPDIALFHANTNNFAGTICPKIARLPYLYEFDISNNQFAGPFPTAILGLNSLTFLDIRFNFFSGAVPPQLFTRNLDALFINNNNFMQRLPLNLGSTHILLLTLANNKFTGPIPRSLPKAFSYLTEVLFLGNQLTGCLPYEIGFFKDAIVFDAGNNKLTGPLPFSLACLKMVEQLNFADNLLFGVIPEVICELGNLVNLSLSSNYFTHAGPLCRSLIDRGALDLRNNCIPGLPFQRSPLECIRFFGYPRFCSRIWSYGYIPCKFPYHNGPVSAVPEMDPSP
ncbi:Leucine-rich repeat receptor-like protein kinase family [Quillaja saponaria]|uniref:Leucine-rich repeat receptor-like protein kinase family n=1 Tax=Quillaja saponaria TaxID=32244 RepID=A0AAD7LHB1_QUISA|nr:Leucine-rich repeat receptor-like protein kinase family [Quillaja saponaria]